MAASRRLIVLIVDDDPGDVLLIQEALEVGRYARSVHVATDGQEAVSFLRRSGDHAGAPRPDVVFLDLNMPGMSGRQVLAEVKADPDLASIPILVFATSLDPAEVLDAYSLYANAYVHKPTDLDEFSAVVADVAEFFTRVVALPTAS